MEFILDNVDKTMELGEKLGKLVRAGDVICLNGDLGTGKTHFVKGLAKGLGITDYITSPTFTIVNEYSGRLKLFHFDVYRVDDPDEISAIGFDEYIFSDAVSIIEWSKFIQELIPEDSLNITIEKLPEKGDNFRKITIESDSRKFDYIKENDLC
jgi:tRNA threonylcarbamoyladenosine biosynthesis protein TsaE